jgi:probable F420-dependent oxidoreductase
MSQRKFRFGVSGRGDTLAQWKDFARKAEDLGYASLDLPDHFARQLAPLPALVAAAQVTTTLRFATTMLDNDFRHPAMLAKEAATVDLLTDGRFELGIGTGSQPHDNEMTGIPLDPPAVRVERMQEILKILRLHFGEQETIDFAGERYQIKDLLAYPKPVQQPMPIMMGARGPRMLRLAAREADIIGVLPGLDGPGGLGEQMAVLRKAAGDRYDRIEFTRLHFDVQVDGRPERTNAGRGPSLVGSRDEIIEQLQQLREETDVSYVMVIGPVIDAFAPVVARLAGT